MLIETQFYIYISVVILRKMACHLIKNVNLLNDHLDRGSNAFNLIMKIGFQLSLIIYYLPNFITH